MVVLTSLCNVHVACVMFNVFFNAIVAFVTKAFSRYFFRSSLWKVCFYLATMDKKKPAEIQVRFSWCWSGKYDLRYFGRTVRISFYGDLAVIHLVIYKCNIDLRTTIINRPICKKFRQMWRPGFKIMSDMLRYILHRIFRHAQNWISNKFISMLFLQCTSCIRPIRAGI